MFRHWKWVVLLSAAGIALIGARPYAGSWNDGGRLATVESFVDHGTWAIDDSIFVEVPADNPPYPASPDLILEHGTLDKLFIRGHFYSDKSPVPNLLLAGVYKLTQMYSGLKANWRPSLFCWWMTACSSGLAYVVAVWGMWKLLTELGLCKRHALLLTMFFAFGTVALCYSRQVNQHIWLLAIAVLLVRQALTLQPSREASLRASRGSVRHLALLGTLTGLGYTIDMAAGPLLFVCMLGWLVTRAWTAIRWSQRFSMVAIFLAAALPWMLLHHAIVYSIAGTIGPPGSVAAYLDWPGSPFHAGNITGNWQHPNAAKFFVYCADLLVGQKGFLGHNPVLFTLLFALPALFRRPLLAKPELFWLLLWSAATFLVYAAASNNYSGYCVSVRWFVPLLAPAFFALGLYWREVPAGRNGIVILGGWGIAWGVLCWWWGPWQSPPLWLFWSILALGSIHWWAFNARRLYFEWGIRRILLFSYRFLSPATILGGLGGLKSGSKPHGAVEKSI
jgi:hypothetical protein